MEHHIFLHQYKTGGQTLHNILRYQYRNNSIFQIGDKSIEDFIDLSDYQKNNYDLISGHLKFGIHRYLNYPCKYFSIIREPVARMISLFYFIHKKENQLFQLMPYEERKDLKTFILNVNKYSKIHGNNSQTYRLAGAPFDYPNTETWDKTINNNTKDIYQDALNNIKKHFAVIGITEMFDESIISMKRHLNWNKPLFYIKRNVTGKKLSRFDQDTIQLIKKRNELDILIYNNIKNELLNEIEENKTFFRSEKRKLYLNNKIYNFYRGSLRKIVKARRP